MSFRDFTPRKKPQGGLEVEGQNNGVYSPPQSRQPQHQQSRSPSPLHRRTVSNNPGPSPQRLDSLQYSEFSRSKSDTTYQNYHGQSPLSSPYANNDNDTLPNHPQQSLLVQQREEEYAMQVMQQRESELRDINRKMNVVNEIYKDLGEVVDQQQEQIDDVEDQFGSAAEATRRGLEQIEKANKTHKKVTAVDAEQNDDIGGIGGGSASEKRKQFFLLHYISKSLSKSASEIAKMVSVCGGSSADYVDKSSWKK